MFSFRNTLIICSIFFFIFSISSCEKAAEYFSDLFEAEIKIKQNFDLDINEIIPGGAALFPSGFPTDYISYTYVFNLSDLDSSINASTSNIANFTRNDIKSAKVDSVRIYLSDETPVTENNIEYIKISAKNNMMTAALPVSDTTVKNFKIKPSNNPEYAFMMDLPVNPNQEFVQYMKPPTKTIDYIFEAKFKNELIFFATDKYKLEFSYKFLFKK
jgi:hypothetical protein